MTKDREAEIRAIAPRCRHTNPAGACSGCAVRDLLAALDEARAERDTILKMTSGRMLCRCCLKLIEHCDNTVAPLRWTTEPPTSPGWYWARWADPVGCGIVPVERWDDGGLYVDDDNGGCTVAEASWLLGWAGPISPPSEPPGRTTRPTGDRP